MTFTKPYNEIFIKCDCTTEVLHLIKYNNEPDLYISIYEQQKNTTIWGRLKMCWKVLIVGSPYGDQVVLSKASISRLKQWLTSI